MTRNCRRYGIMAIKRDARPVLSNLSDAVEQVIFNAQAAGVDLDDIEDKPKVSSLGIVKKL